MQAANPPRLKRRAEFLRAASAGRKAAYPGLVLQALTRDGEAATMPARCGFTVTKRVGNSVVRNRARRRLREAARLALAERPLVGHDIVLIGREGTLTRPFSELIRDVERALRRAGAREDKHTGAREEQSVGAREEQQSPARDDKHSAAREEQHAAARGDAG